MGWNSLNTTAMGMEISTYSRIHSGYYDAFSAATFDTLYGISKSGLWETELFALDLHLTGKRYTHGLSKWVGNEEELHTLILVRAGIRHGAVPRPGIHAEVLS